jgi:hypothetical protein
MKSLSFTEATKTIYAREGMQGFMRGFAPSMVKSVMNSGTYFGMLHYFESVLK